VVFPKITVCVKLKQRTVLSPLMYTCLNRWLKKTLLSVKTACISQHYFRWVIY